MKHPVLRVLSGISAVLLAYVVYAHLASWRRSAEYRTAPMVVTFNSSAELDARFTVESTGSLSHAREGTTLRVRGSCDRAGARLVLLGKSVRLGPSRARMRARALAVAPVDVMVGIEQDGRELRFGLAAGAAEGAALRVVGDPGPTGARATGDRVLSTIEGVTVPVGEAAPAREIALTFEPDLLSAIASLDGVVLRSTSSLWPKAALARPAFSVTCRDAAPRVDIEITEIAWEPLIRDTSPLDLDDRFTGEVFDTRWRVSRATSGEAADVAVTLGHGLGLTAKSKRLTGPTSVLALYSPRVRAETFHSAIEVDVKAIKQGSIHIGVSNPYVGLAFFRTLDVGVTERDGKLVPFTSGHFKNDGQPAFQFHETALPDLQAPGRVVIELDFDAKARTARGRVNGAVLYDGAVALQPYEDIVFRAGVNADGSGADLAIVVDRLTFRRSPP